MTGRDSFCGSGSESPVVVASSPAGFASDEVLVVSVFAAAFCCCSALGLLPAEVEVTTDSNFVLSSVGLQWLSISFSLAVVDSNFDLSRFDRLWNWGLLRTCSQPCCHQLWPSQGSSCSRSRRISNPCAFCRAGRPGRLLCASHLELFPPSIFCLLLALPCNSSAVCLTPAPVMVTAEDENGLPGLRGSVIRSRDWARACSSSCVLAQGIFMLGRRFSGGLRGSNISDLSGGGRSCSFGGDGGGEAFSAWYWSYRTINCWLRGERFMMIIPGCVVVDFPARASNCPLSKLWLQLVFPLTAEMQSFVLLSNWSLIGMAF